MVLKVSGVPDAIYDVTADSYGMRVDSIEGGRSMDVIVDLALPCRLSGTYSVSQDTLTRVPMRSTSRALDINAHFKVTHRWRHQEWRYRRPRCLPTLSLIDGLRR
jgi:hypothetical protein